MHLETKIQQHLVGGELQPYQDESSSELWVVAWFIYKALWWILVVLSRGIFVLFYICYAFLTAPYTLLYYSSNISMRSKHFPPVELYLAHFERLYPNLMEYVAASFKLTKGQDQYAISSWPHDTSRSVVPLGLVTLSHTEWTFTRAAGLFSHLEAAGWKREVIWTFLRDTVERANLVTQEEKDAFAKVLKIMTTHQILGLGAFRAAFRSLRSTLCFRNDDGREVSQQQQLTAERYASMGLPIVHVQGFP